MVAAGSKYACRSRGIALSVSCTERDLNSVSGDVILLITAEWVAESRQDFLQMVRAHWHGWHLILFEDRGTPDTAEESIELAKQLDIEIRLLPRATPKLNAMDNLWRSVKGRRRRQSLDDLY